MRSYSYFHTDQIINRIKEAGFRIISRKDVGLTKELAGQFYHEHEGKDFYNGLTDYMSRYLPKPQHVSSFGGYQFSA